MSEEEWLGKVTSAYKRNQGEIEKIRMQFNSEIQEIHAADILVSISFKYFLKEQLPSWQAEIIRDMPEIENVEMLDDRPFVAGAGHPDDPNRIPLFEFKQGEIKEMIAEDGLLQNKVRQSCIVSLYHLWEGYYRSKLARSLGLKVKRIKSDLMDDLRHLRNVIIHKKGICNRKLENAHVLKWFKKGQAIVLTKEMYNQLAEELWNMKFVIIPPSQSLIGKLWGKFCSIFKK